MVKSRVKPSSLAAIQQVVSVVFATSESIPCFRLLVWQFRSLVDRAESNVIDLAGNEVATLRDDNGVYELRANGHGRALCQGTRWNDKPRGIREQVALLQRGSGGQRVPGIIDRFRRHPSIALIEINENPCGPDVRHLELEVQSSSLHVKVKIIPLDEALRRIGDGQAPLRITDSGWIPEIGQVSVW